MNKEELLDCLKKLSKTNNLRDGIDIKKEEANIIVNEIKRLEQALQEEKKTTNHAYKLWKSIDNSHIEKIYKLEEEIERLNKELEIAKDNEETYRLEMLDITKRLGLKEDTMFDEVKDKAERLNNIIKEVREYVSRIIIDETYTKCIL